MYAAQIKGVRLNFTVSGMLWNRSLVMRDLETRSLWSHILGRAMDGKLKGTELEIIPSVMTSWASWKEDYPATSVLALNRTSKEYRAKFQRDSQRFVLGLVWKGKAVAYPFGILNQQPVLNDIFQEQPLVVTFDPVSTGGMIFNRRLDDRVLTFTGESPGRMKDGPTQSIWDLKTGKCLEGQLKGAQLEALPAVISYRRVWREFHPETVVKEL